MAAEQAVGGLADDPRGVGFDDEAGNASPPRGRIGLGVDTEEVRARPVAHPRLLAIEAPARSVPARGGGDGRRVAPPLGLGEEERTDPLSRDQGRQPPPPLLGGPVPGEVAGEVVVHHERERGSHARRRERLHREGHRGHGKAPATERLRHGQPAEPPRRRLAKGLGRHPSRLVPRGRVRLDDLAGERARRLHRRRLPLRDRRHHRFETAHLPNSRPVRWQWAARPPFVIPRCSISSPPQCSFRYSATSRRWQW